MGDLPEEPVTLGEKAFSKSAVDYFGPFLVKRGNALAKGYGCLFTSLSSRTVQIEVH